jgi:hypothetical protein
MSVGWASPSSRGLWGGAALLLSSKVRVRVRAAGHPGCLSHHPIASGDTLRDTHAHTELFAHPPAGVQSKVRRLPLGAERTMFEHNLLNSLSSLLGP